MLYSDEIQIASLDPKQRTVTTESGELERPVVRRRRIDCGGNTEVTDRRATRGTGSADAKAEPPTAS